MERRIICSLCLTKNRFVTRYKLRNFNIVECKKCHLLARSLVFKRNELEKLYSKNYFSRLQKDYFSAGISQDFESSLRVKDFRHRLNMISSVTGLKHGKILDIGAGTGVFLKVARDRGWNVAGVEISQFAADIARKKFNIGLFRGELEDASFKRKSFDVVTAWDLIEHVENPRGTVTKAMELLKPGGYLVLQTTTTDSLLFRIAGAIYNLSLGKISVLAEMAYPIHHANHFDRKTVIKLLKDQEFKIVAKKNVEMHYEETSLPKIFLPILNFIGKIAGATGSTIEIFVAAKKIK